MQSLDQIQKQKIRLVGLAAQLMLESGGETYRVEETAMRMAAGLGLDDVNVVAFPTSIFVNVDGFSRIRRITRRGANTSRIARINDLMWSELFVANKAALLKQMDLFLERFVELKGMLEIEDIDGMRAMMRRATERRALFDKK